jgi:imidazole glycerol-phosphate synthase subunit HisH
MQSKITIVDYGMGNLRSVQKKFIKIGAQVQISGDPKIIEQASKLVLPGVGHFANGVQNLKDFKLWNILNEQAKIKQIPILGICLGMQLMANRSEEGNVKGLGWFDADIVRFRIKDTLRYKVPHMGWNNISNISDNPLFAGISKEAMFYFVHSFHIKCYNKKDISTTTAYEYSFTSAIQNNNIYGTQFHPEKSHEWGERIFRNFATL